MDEVWLPTWKTKWNVNVCQSVSGIQLAVFPMTYEIWWRFMISKFIITHVILSQICVHIFCKIGLMFNKSGDICCINSFQEQAAVILLVKLAFHCSSWNISLCNSLIWGQKQSIWASQMHKSLICSRRFGQREWISLSVLFVIGVIILVQQMLGGYWEQSGLYEHVTDFVSFVIDYTISLDA